jgi:Peptidase family M48
MTFRKIPLTALIFALGISAANAKRMPRYEQMRPLTPEQSDLVNRAIAQEKVVIRNIQQRTPLVETYIQNTRPSQKLYEVPVSDYYVLSRVDFSRGFFDKTYDPRIQQEHHGFFRGSVDAMNVLGKLLGLERFTYNPNGFMDMMFIDPRGFDREHYQFSFVRREFLGSVKTSVFDVHPRVPGMGRFFGRIWVEDQGGNIVRFNGTYTGPHNQDSSKYFFHFDSWRMNMQPDLWLPVAVYVEETHRVPGSKSEGLKAQTHFWGYSLKLPSRESENVSIKVDNAVDNSGQSQDVGPLQASRMWIEQAENNVIDRLEQAGLVAPAVPGGYEQKVLDQIVINLVVPNNLEFTEQVHCRVLLTDTIEATTVGNTILLSKGLIDSLPNEPAFAAVIAMELAHIALGHHIDTRYAFNDRLLFPDESTFQRIDMYHSAADDLSAATTATKYLENSMYKNQLADAGLYFEQLQARAQALKALNTPKLGDSLLNSDGVPWMDALEKMAPKLNWENVNQTAALPLGSWLKVDPWDDTVHMLNAKRYAPLNASEKMPFEVTPIFFNLQRYDVANNQTPAAPAGQPAAQEPAAPQSGGSVSAAAQQPPNDAQN